MDGFSLTCAIISMVFMVVFNFICIRKFGLLSCFSAYGAKWGDWAKTHINMAGTTNIWTHITIVSALLLIPPVLTTTIGNQLQFLFFFMPAYLLLVGLTPDYKEDYKHYVYHLIGVGLTALSLIFWLIYAVHKIGILFPVLTLALIIAFATNTFKGSWIYYLEMTLYLTAYIALLIF